jgi:hypothetical protein
VVQGAELNVNTKRRLEQLEQECHDKGVKLIYDDLRSEGGLCRLRDCYYLILNRRLAAETKARAITDALARVPTRDMTRFQPGIGIVSQVEAVPPAPVIAGSPAPEYEEHTVSVPVAAGVPGETS